MGLDISAYSKLTKVETPELDADGYPVDYDNVIKIDEHDIAFTEKDWPGRTAGLSIGCFTFEGKTAFRAGSYGGYNSWRDELARLAGFADAEDVWNMESPQGPFVELINFSDCEGSIGPEVSAKLAKDFASHADNVGSLGYFADKYREWQKAFELAADGGLVDFH